jgi:hypothetical protein
LIFSASSRPSWFCVLSHPSIIYIFIQSFIIHS